MPLEHWMMFSTFAEQDYFIYPRSDVYSGVFINANMAAHAPAGLASFIIEKLNPETKYMVDPITHAFQHDPVFIKNDKGEVKKAIQSLAEAYGDPMLSHVGRKPLSPSQFDEKTLASLCPRVLGYQRDHLRGYMEGSDAAKYLDSDEIKSPSALVAPYFFLTETEWSGWLTVNTDAVAVSLEALQPGERLFAEVVVDRGVLLDARIRAQVVKAYSRFQNMIAGFLLWIDNFDEQSVPMAELRAFKEFCHSLKSIAPEVINLHGGYFSILMGGTVGSECLTGVAHGPEFGEFRSVVPVGGGIPIARYYVPRLHARVRYREAADFFQAAGWLETADRFIHNVCNCEECLDTLASDAANFTKFGEGDVKNVRRRHGMVRIEFPSAETKRRCLRHYLQRKHREFQMVRNAEPGASLRELQNSIDVHENLVGTDGVAHLKRWKQVLSPKEGDH
ncbi:MAG: hypothetical protein KF858_05070 [Candidatus Sumerlaeia bacterium]|nr:hypothetical protein [Candidatus Sumerlaeia bacterium]